ncbi:MAG TPA: lytic transglycosylase domain-containing protein [Streptosporangiaceae bacterium]|jgi:hypothetical protein
MVIGPGPHQSDVKVAGSPLTEEPAPRSDEPAPTGPRIAGVRIPGGRTGLIAAAAAVVVLAGGGGAMALTSGGGDGETGTVAPARLAPSIAADAMRQPTEEQNRKLMADRASRAARRDAAKPPVLAVRGTPPPDKTKKPDEPAASAGNPVPAGTAQRIAKAMMPKFGFNPSTQFGCLVNLWNKESHWNVHAGSPGGPYGIPQANPGTKMASAGSDWRDSANTQIEWGLGYIKGRYGGPCDAWSHSQSTGWY